MLGRQTAVTLAKTFPPKKPVWAMLSPGRRDLARVGVLPAHWGSADLSPPEGCKVFPGFKNNSDKEKKEKKRAAIVPGIVLLDLQDRRYLTAAWR